MGLTRQREIDGLVKWEYVKFEILQVIPCTDMLAVYAEEYESRPGKYKLIGLPIFFLALAKQTTTYFERPKDSKPGTDVSERIEDDGNVVVGLDLMDGYFEVCNEASNFSGYCRVGEDIKQATGFLNYLSYPLYWKK